MCKKALLRIRLEFIYSDRELQSIEILPTQQKLLGEMKDIIDYWVHQLTMETTDINKMNMVLSRLESQPFMLLIYALYLL